jgi:hypothetical protein
MTLDVYERTYLAMTSGLSYASNNRHTYLEKVEDLRKILHPLLDVVSVALLVEDPRPF